MNYFKKMSIEEIQKDLLSDEKGIRDIFTSNYTSGIVAFTKSFVKAYDLLSELPIDQLKQHHRVSTVFLLNGFNCIYTSFKLLINGYSLASGNIMRQFGESIATAIISSTDKFHYAKEIEDNPHRFAYQKTVTLLRKKEIQKVLDLNETGINVFESIQKGYDDYSHATYGSFGWSLKLGDKEKHFFGPIYDYEKKDLYRQEIVTRKSGCNVLYDVTNLFIKMRKNEIKIKSAITSR